MAGRKPKSAAVDRSDFAALLADVKGRIQAAQTRAVLAVNAELVRLYWDIGRIIRDRQKHAGWGAAVIPGLARELHNELPDLKGFSERNIKLMVQLASEYPQGIPATDSIGQLPVAQLYEGILAAQSQVHARLRRGVAGRGNHAAGCCTNALVEAGLVEERGSKKGRTWHLSAAAYRALGDKAGYVRSRGYRPLIRLSQGGSLARHGSKKGAWYERPA